MRRKLKASSLLEAVVATVVIMICFMIAIAVISNVTGNNKFGAKQKARLLLNECLIRVKKEKRFLDEKMVFGDFTVIEKVTKYSGCENLNEINFIVTDNKGKLLVKHNELVLE